MVIYKSFPSLLMVIHYVDGNLCMLMVIYTAADNDVFLQSS